MISTISYSCVVRCRGTAATEAANGEEEAAAACGGEKAATAASGGEEAAAATITANGDFYFFYDKL